MKSNVDYTICPECDALNAAMWNPHGDRSYDVTCTVCGYEFEHGYYDSNDIVLFFDDLPDAHLHFGVDRESIGAILQMAEEDPGNANFLPGSEDWISFYDPDGD